LTNCFFEIGSVGMIGEKLVFLRALHPDGCIYDLCPPTSKHFTGSAAKKFNLLFL
jgi:hypothetical protein